jgi:hypothetical protein
MRWMVSFGIASLGGIAVVLFILWGTNGFHGLGLGTAGIVAVVLCICVASALGVALMALVFYSDSSNTDEAIYHATDDGGKRAGTKPSIAGPEGDGARLLGDMRGPGNESHPASPPE